MAAESMVVAWALAGIGKEGTCPSLEKALNRYRYASQVKSSSIY